MKTLITLLSIALIPIITGAQTTQNRQVGDFTGREASASVKVVLTQGEPPSIKVEADEKDQANVKTEVKNGKLIISEEGKITSEVTVYVTAKSLNSIEASGAAIIKSQNQIIADNIKIQSSGASSIKLDIKANEINSSISGA